MRADARQTSPAGVAGESGPVSAWADPLALWRGVDDAVRCHVPGLRLGGPLRPAMNPLVPAATREGAKAALPEPV